MKKPLSIFFACATSVVISTSVFANTQESAAIYKSAQSQAATEFKISRAKCDALADNPKDVCIAEAKARRIHIEENAKATYKDTLKARVSAIKSIADADYEVDKTKCAALTGNDKDVCIKKAKSTKVATIATASADKKVIEARTDEKEDKKAAEYKVAIEKCDAMTGNAKDACVAAAKLKFGK